jgi:RNA polymerase sigma-70 factor (ECF subfamily)
MSAHGSNRHSEIYRELRPTMFSIAYRMLGSVSEAEDVVQDAFVRLQRADPDEIAQPQAYMATVTTRLAIDRLRAARNAREEYIGPWIPEPLVADVPGPADSAETADSLSLAFLVLLESLSPVERAVFLLREVFGYGYEAIAGIVGKTEDNCRQVATRARRHLEARKPRFEASYKHREEMVRQFLAACEEGDTAALVDLLAADVEMYGDGGGKAPALGKPVFGRDRVARVLLGFSAQAAALQARAKVVDVNGQPGAMFLDGEGRLINVVSLDIADGQIGTVRSIVNPDKLRHLGPLTDVGALVRSLATRNRAGTAP